MKARRKWLSKKKPQTNKTKQKNKTKKNKNKNTKLNSRDNYLCVIITLSPKQGVVGGGGGVGGGGTHGKAK